MSFDEASFSPSERSERASTGNSLRQQWIADLTTNTVAAAADTAELRSAGEQVVRQGNQLSPEARPPHNGRDNQEASFSALMQSLNDESFARLPLSQQLELLAPGFQPGGGVQSQRQQTTLMQHIASLIERNNYNASQTAVDRFQDANFSALMQSLNDGWFVCLPLQQKLELLAPWFQPGGGVQSQRQRTLLMQHVARLIERNNYNVSQTAADRFNELAANAGMPGLQLIRNPEFGNEHNYWNLRFRSTDATVPQEPLHYPVR